MRKSIFLLYAISVVMFYSFAATIRAAEPTLPSAILIAETLDEETIIGVRLEYPGEVNAGEIKYDKTYRVNGYPIIGTFVNNDGAWNNARTKGKYVFLKFAIDQVPATDFTGRTITYYGRFNYRMAPTVTVRQAGAVTLLDKTVVPPFDVTATEIVNPEIDRFLDLAYIDASGAELRYRLFVPEGYEKRKDELANLPLVLFLHGGGDSDVKPAGRNLIQLLSYASALEYARPRAQAQHPCFVMAPQSAQTVLEGGVWAVNKGTKENPDTVMTPSMVAAIEALQTVCKEYNVDTDRLYCTGLSQGSRGTFIANMSYPDLFAAQINIASGDVYTDAQAQMLVSKPIWSLVAVNDRSDRIGQLTDTMEQIERLGGKLNRRVGDDALDGFLRGPAADQQIIGQWNDAKAKGQHQLMTYFVEGTVLPDPHNSWRYVYNNDALRDWLFSHKKSK